MLNNIKLLGLDGGINNSLITELKELQQKLKQCITDFNDVPEATSIKSTYVELDTKLSGMRGKVYQKKLGDGGVANNFDKVKDVFLIAQENNMKKITKNGIVTKYPKLETLVKVKMNGGAILKTGGKYTRKNKNIRKRSRKMKPKMKVSRKNKFNSKKNTKKNAKKYAKKKTKKRSRKIYKISRNSKKRSRKSMNY